MIKYFLFLLVGVCITMLLFLTKPTEANRSRILILCFIFQLYIPQLLKQSVSGIEAGGSALYNIVLILSWILPATLLIYLSSMSDTHSLEQKLERKTFLMWAVVFGWIILFMLECIYVYFSPTRIVPVVSTFVFLVLFLLSIVSPIDSNSLLEEMTKIAALFSLILLIGFILRFNYFGSNEFEGTNVDSAYFSPLSVFLGLPSRLSGPFVLFGGAQIMGLFFTFAQACNGLRVGRRGYWIYSFLLFLSGSATGSRTFYVTFFLTTIFTTIFSAGKKNAASWIRITTSGGLVLLGGFYIARILVARANTSGQRLSEINGRAEIWSATWQHWHDRGYLGHGPRQFREIIATYVGFPAAHTHNSFLEYLWNYGIFGGFAILMVYLSMLIMSIKNHRNSRAPIILLLTVLVVVTERNLRINMQDIVGLFWLIILNTLLRSRIKGGKLT